ncbi:uncharacterized protein LOC119650973 [Hermetia illucens]|uniref:uncharacterized protein LOC119650973 n=1 Tax=Hermetia illucens TaxID=343691 RepID=UPI0018CC618B|nr:uncharacterized protein LOC119650973 [Hermetia illucens]
MGITEQSITNIIHLPKSRFKLRRNQFGFVINTLSELNAVSDSNKPLIKCRCTGEYQKGRSQVTFLYTWLHVNVDQLIKPSKINAPHESHLKFVEIILILWSIKTPKICMQLCCCKTST